MNVVGYTRLSQESDTSIKRQKNNIREYCEKNNIELDEIKNEGKRESGYDTERDKYNEIKGNIEDINKIIVNDRERLGRDFDEKLRFLLNCREKNTEIHTVKEGKLNLGNAKKIVMESMHAEQAHTAKKKEIEKAKEAVKERQQKGYWQGGEKYGTEFDEEGKYLVPDENFEKVLKAIELSEEIDNKSKIARETGINRSTLYSILDDTEFYIELEKKHSDKNE